MSNHDEIIPREVEREWIAAYAILAALGSVIVALLGFGWWVVVILTALFIWQVARVVRITNRHIRSDPG